jgi:hypothetical protein
MLGRVWGRQGAPVAAISLVAGLTLLGLKLGRSAVDPIISMSSVLLGAVYLASCLALLRLQQADGMRGGALALARAGAAAALVVLAAAGRDLLLQGAAGLPVMSVLAVWSALGLVVWRLAAGRTPPSPHSTDSEQRTDMASPQHRPGMGRP